MCRPTRFLAASMAILALVAFMPILLQSADNPQKPFQQLGDAMTGATACDCGTWGDVTGDGEITPLDISYMAKFVYKSLDALVQPASCPRAAGDANCDKAITPLDMILFVNLVYRSNGAGWCGDPCSPEASLVGTSECKSYQLGKSTAYVSPDSECVAYEYDGLNILRLTHINTGFNCCPEPIFAEILIEPGLITIDEFEGMELGGCDCLCLFDVDYEIINLPPGEYTIRINGLYLLPGEEPIEFTVDLAANPSGQYCVYRGHYPWGY